MRRPLSVRPDTVRAHGTGPSGSLRGHGPSDRTIRSLRCRAGVRKTSFLRRLSPQRSSRHWPNPANAGSGSDPSERPCCPMDTDHRIRRGANTASRRTIDGHAEPVCSSAHPRSVSRVSIQVDAGREPVQPAFERGCPETGRGRPALAVPAGSEVPAGVAKNSFQSKRFLPSTTESGR